MPDTKVFYPENPGPDSFLAVLLFYRFMFEAAID
jgi:hypothetical protein